MASRRASTREDDARAASRPGSAVRPASGLHADGVQASSLEGDSLRGSLKGSLQGDSRQSGSLQASATQASTLHTTLQASTISSTAQKYPQELSSNAGRSAAVRNRIMGSVEYQLGAQALKDASNPPLSFTRQRIENANKCMNAKERVAKDTRFIETMDIDDVPTVDERHSPEWQSRRTAMLAVTKKRLTCALMPHQELGVLWMQSREAEKQCQGGLLADDMGFGKTVQSIALMLLNMPPVDNTAAVGHRELTLVVVPTGLLDQWVDELRDKTKNPPLRVYLHYGPKRLADLRAIVGHFDVVVTSYGTVASECQNGSTGALKTIDWFRVFLDEAHTIKNIRTKNAIACHNLIRSRCWCLTGTPVQNNVDELQSLLTFIKVDETLIPPKAKGKQLPDILRYRTLLIKFMLRRTKKSTLDGKPILAGLPPRLVELSTIKFTPQEREFYQKLQDRLKKEASQNQGEIGFMHLLAQLTRLRQAVNHPYLTRMNFEHEPSFEEKTDETEINELTDLMGGLIVKTQSCYICQASFSMTVKTLYCNDCASLYTMTNTFSTTSSKILRMLRVLKDSVRDEPGCKTIVFSQFTQFLDMLEAPLTQHGYIFCRYDGSMSKAKRDESVSYLCNDPEVTIMLISLKAGSLGLNLTVANRVILLDSWWNPMIEDQAIDRVHRIGQTKTVKVVKIIVENSVDDRILQLQEKKRLIANHVLGDADQPSPSRKGKKAGITTSDLMNLISG